MAPVVEAAAADPEAYFDGPYMESANPLDVPRYLAVRDQMIRSLRETYGNGIDTIADEITATFGPWGFDLGTIAPPVRAWHGDADTTPMQPIQFLVEQVPDGEITIYPGEGHAMSPEHHPDWVATLTDWAR